MQLWRLPAAVLLALVCAPLSVSAQETRAEAIERQRAEKATQLKPYEPGRLELFFRKVGEENPLTRVSPVNGFFLAYGYTGKPVGSGTAVSGGWRHDLIGRKARVVLEAGQSLRGYRMVRGDFFMPRLLDQRLEIGVETSYRYHPQEDFYGLGFGSLEADRTNFLYEAPEIQGRAMFKPVPWFNAGARVGSIDVTVGRGKDNQFPDTASRFNEAAAAGLSSQPKFLYNDLFATFDTRDQPGNPRAGGYYGVLWRRYNDRDTDVYSFDRIDADLQQFLPVFDKKRVVALRLQLNTTTAGNGNDVPFYFQPTLGGADSLRGAAEFRYRDRNTLSLNVEYRWEAFSGLDMALFSDFGSVAPRFSGLEFADLESAYGIGLRFNTYKAVFLRIDVAGGGRDGIKLYTKFSGNF
ncbi:MAG TPA: BamA/TamA family outer membrane protein [Gemmatimonadaceae bacterium]|nr:BamA/TamA family outer membrane protein [Gemmatimonadaceae bacterium]